MCSYKRLYSYIYHPSEGMDEGNYVKAVILTSSEKSGFFICLSVCAFK